MSNAEQIAAGRSLAYAAVTARIADDEDQVAECIYEMLQDPMVAACGILALLHTCKAVVELLADTTPLTTDEAWARFASAVAWAAICEQDQEPEPRT